MTQRTIRKITPAPTHYHGPGLTTRDAGAASLGDAMDPFIMASLYDMAGPTFPPHPHAGFSVVTYILPDSDVGFINQDSRGTLNTIPPGALHWTTAGSGILHEEQPEMTGKVARGYQIWIDLKNGERQMPPAALHLAVDEVPQTHVKGSTIFAVLGASNELVSPLQTPTHVRLIDVIQVPDAVFTQELFDDENAFVFMISGEADINGHVAKAGDLVATARDGTRLVVTASAQGARFTLFAGVPFDQSRAQRGPFVASDAHELAGYMTRYAQGDFGQLRPFAEQSRL
jgi:redox-sensitive bicupin YhaK (pirin superfamily)